MFSKILSVLAPSPVEKIPRCFIDTETTGLDPDLHEVIEAAFIRVGADGVVQTFVTKIKPKSLINASEKALEINQYSDEEWCDAPTFEQVEHKIRLFLEGAYLVGHNVRFDVEMFEHMYKRHGVAPLKLRYHVIDTVTLAYTQLGDLLPGLGLYHMRKAFGISDWKSHRALKDISDTRTVYRILTGSLPGLWKIKTRLRLQKMSAAVETLIDDHIKSSLKI